MRVLIAIVICLWCLPASAEVLSILQIRDLYYSANDDRKCADRFYHSMQQMDDKNKPLLLGYKGVASIMRAKYGFDPLHKLNCFSKGKALLEQAVKLDPKNVEIRFLRYCVQSQAPAILMYHSALAEDRAIIAGAYPRLADADLRVRIKNYMLQYDTDIASHTPAW